jgi:hypothetical protein
MNANVFCNQCHRIPNECVCWTSCLDCGQRVTGDSIHTCSPQIKELSDKEIEEIWKQAMDDWTKVDDGTARLANQPFVFFARAILKKASEK